jgi:hypothetical protein
MTRAKARTRRKPKAKPLARPGVPIFTSTFRIELRDRHEEFYWIASENPNYRETVRVSITDDGDLRLSGGVIAGDGPFATEAEATAAAREAVAGDADLKQGGAWDPNWAKPQ